MVERSFVMVKPAHFHLAEEIYRHLDPLGERIRTAIVQTVDRRLIEEHYRDYQKESYFELMLQQFIGNPVSLAIYAGEGVVKRIIDKVGHTEPGKAVEGTVRRIYGGNDTYEKADSEGRFVIHNVIHRASSPAEAEKEIRIWNQYLGL